MSVKEMRDSKPTVLAVCTPSTGHVVPMLQIASCLIDDGYDVWFLTHPSFAEQVQKSKAKFIPALRSWNFSGVENLYKALVDHTGPTRHERWLKYYNDLYKEIWVRNIPPCLESIRRAMTIVRQSKPDHTQDLVILAETWVPGIIPLKLGAELPEGFTKPPKTLGISVIPPQFTSLDQGPHVYGPLNIDLGTSMGLPHRKAEVESAASREAIRARNVLLARLTASAFAPVWDALRFVLRMCGASQDIYGILAGEDHMLPQIPSTLSFLAHDTTLQMCIPSLEYETQWPDHVKFGGTLPPKPLDPAFELPSWFRSLEETKATKRIVFTTQGTIAVEYGQLIVPTIKGLAGRGDVMVVATLGRKGANLDKFFPSGLPANAVVVDYFPYGPLLENADVVVTNGSYGIYSQCAAYGVPMVLGGAFSEDKPEIGNRAEYAGLGIFLRSHKPSEESLVEAIDRVLSEDQYKKRALELREEVEKFPCLETVKRELSRLRE